MRAAALLLLLAGCRGEDRARPAPTSPPWRVELPGAVPRALEGAVGGGVIAALTFTRALAIGPRTFTPDGAVDGVVVALAADGQPGAAIALGLRGATRLDVLGLDGDAVLIDTDGTFRIGVSGYPAGRWRVTLDLAKGPVAAQPLEGAVATPAPTPAEIAALDRAAFPATVALELPDAAVLLAGPCDAGGEVGCLARVNAGR